MFSFGKSLVKRLVIHFLLGFDRLHRATGIPILQYHRVSGQFSPEYDVATVFPQDFAWQVDLLLHKGYEVVTLSQVLEHLDENSGKNPRCVALTFDDGHKDNLLYAYPILKARKVRATMFVVSDYVGCAGWLDRQNGWSDTRTESGRFHQLLSWDELRQMTDVFDIGSHGRTHRDLTRLSRNEMQDEIEGSRQSVYEHLGIWPCFFCYPYGTVDGAVANLAKRASYAGACGVQKGLNTLNTDRYQLKRNEIGIGISRQQFELLLSEHIKTFARLTNWVNRRPR